jgi:hypothetical protein
MSSPITIIQPVATVGQLSIDLTLHEGSGRTAVQVTRASRTGPPRRFTIFASELDRALNALDEAADLLLGTDSDSDSPNQPAIAGARK